MRFFNPPTELVAEVFATIPAHLSKSGQPSTWIESNHPGSKLGCFLEGPAFDRAGNLYVVDIPFGRIFRITPDAQVSVAAEYDGWPNGLAVHKDGRLFITDYRLGVMTCDPATGKVEPWITHARSEGFKASTTWSSPATATCTSPTRGRPACTTRPAVSGAPRPTAS